MPVQVPMVTRCRSFASQIPCNPRPKLQKPAANSFIGNIQTPLGEQILDIPITQGETSIKPNSVANDFRREAVALIRNVFHSQTLIEKILKIHLS